MGYYLICIGGTGAKCMEAVTHLSAADLMPEGKIYTLFVDPDSANGNLERCRETIKSYRNFKNIGLGSSELLKTEIATAREENKADSNGDVWSPVGESGSNNLEKIFTYNTLKSGKDTASASLFDVLFSRQEREVNLTQGFRGHPSIGAVMMASNVRLGEVEPWKTFRSLIANDIQNGIESKVFIIGSIFGGTGASGFPTIAKLIKKEFSENNKLRIGGALILPYFKFLAREDNELKAASEFFLINTQAALNYYYSQKYLDIYNSIYVLGSEEMTQVDYSIGAGTQRNEPHLLELLAAMAASHFFTDSQSSGIHILARKQSEFVEWGDLPDGNEGKSMKQKLGKLVRFAISYLNIYYPWLAGIRSIGKGYRAPWYINYFQRTGMLITDDGILESAKAVKKYCEQFLQWIRSLHRSADSYGIKLIDHTLYDFVKVSGNELELKFDPVDLNRLVVNEKAGSRGSADVLWENMCSTRQRATGMGKFGNFICALYENCDKAILG